MVLGGSAPPAGLAAQRRHDLRDDRDGQRRRLRRRTSRRGRGRRRPGRRRDPAARPDAAAGLPRRHRPPTPTAGSRPATPARSTATAGSTSTAGCSDMIITGGENVWPAPVEAALRTHPRGRCGRGRAARSRVGPAGGGLGRARRPVRPADAPAPAGGRGRAHRPLRRPRASWYSSTRSRRQTSAR